MGYVEERQVDGRSMQIPAELGEAKGISSMEKTSKIGTVYTVPEYPPVVQKEIVEHYTKIGEQVASYEDDRY